MIPCESSKKNITFSFFYFWPKKAKVFDIIVIKTFLLKRNLVIFDNKFFFSFLFLKLKHLHSQGGDSMWKQREKHNIFFFYFWPKKAKVFDIIVKKKFLVKKKFGHFWQQIFFLDFFFWSYENWCFAIKSLFLFFKSKMPFLLSQVKITLNVYIVIFKEYLFVVHPNIFFSYFHI